MPPETVLTPEPDQKAEPVRLAVCTNHRYGVDRPSCGARLSEQLADQLEQAVKEAGLDFTIERHVCFGRCGQGPTMRFIPGGDFHFRVTEADIPELIRKIKTAYSEDSQKRVDEPSVDLIGS